MATTQQTRIVAGPVAEVFDYLAAFENTAGWDPGVVSAQRLDVGPPREGTRFRVVVRFVGREQPMTYRITRYEPPHRLELEGASDGATAIDRITLRPVGAGATEVTWHLEVTPRGLGRLGSPLLGPLLDRLGRAALDGLQAARQIHGAGPGAAPDTAVRVQGWSHVGIRVADRERSLAFYRRLGFRQRAWYEGPKVAILDHASGVELNLIVNADPDAGDENVLMDVPVKRAGVTHLALRVADTDRLVAELAAAGIPLSGGPDKQGEHSIGTFVRDPDRNVIELTEVIG